jgi:Delta7-sterol 5-desaturase
MNSNVELVYPWYFDWTAIVVRYFLFAGLTYSLFYLLDIRFLRKLKIQNAVPPNKIIRQEIFYSSLTLVIYCATSSLIFYLYGLGVTRIYIDLNQRSIYYFVLSFVLMILLHDAYFYWTHRLLHIRLIFKRAHLLHHRSVNPTPWASFSFHPYEAILSAGIIPLIVLTIPCHPYAIFAFLTFMTITNVLGHLGYEIFPKSFRQNSVGKWQNTASAHNIHHQHGKFNFGLYFTFWDRIMKTYRDL